MRKDKLILFIFHLLLVQCIRSEDVCEADRPEPKKPQCCDGVIQSFITTSNYNNGTCSFNYATKTEIPRCIDKPEERGECQPTKNGQFYCLAEDTFYITATNSQCQCENRPNKRLRVCCCKDPETSVTCDKVNGIKVTTTTTYALVTKDGLDSCVSTENSTRVRIRFATKYITRKGDCGNNGYRTNVITKMYLDGCDIKEEFNRNEIQPCRCPNNVKRAECRGDQLLVTRVYSSKLECCSCSCSCVETLATSTRRKITCPPPKVKKTECSYDSGTTRRVITTSSLLKNCECVPTKKESKECCRCIYKELTRTVGECCECRGTETVTIRYLDADCKKKEKIFERPCRCIPPIPEIPTVTSCENGVSYTTTFNSVCDNTTFKYITNSVKVQKVIKCRPKKVTVGPCGAERRYYSKQTTTEYKPDTVTCLCTAKAEVVYLICCPNSPKIPDFTCVRNKYWERKVTNYTINRHANKCDQRTVTTSIEVTCKNSKPDRITIIDECSKVTTRYSSHVENCKCVTTKVDIPYVCCYHKPRPTTRERCENQKTKVTTVTTWVPNNCHTKCVPVISKSKMVIACKEYFNESRTKCVDGKYTIKKRYYEVRNCKCTKVRVVKTPVIIKCPKSTTSTSCNSIRWIITTASWSIVDCQCIGSSKVVHKPVECPAPVKSFGKCNGVTGEKTEKTTFYEIVNCKCVVRTSHRQVPCPCAVVDRIERLSCFGNMRVVRKLRYGRVKHKCQWRVIVTEMEHCEPCKGRTVKDCFKNAFHRTTITSYHLVPMNLKLVVNRCVKRTCGKIDPVVCNKDYSYTTPCKNFRQSVISCTYTSIKCKCVERCQTDCIRACDCRRKNKCSETCIDNRKYKICLSYSENGDGCGCGCAKTVSTCAESVDKVEIPIICTLPARSHWCGVCNIIKNNGYYRLCTTLSVAVENCKCKQRSTQAPKLCRCFDKCVSAPFCENNKLVTITTTFTPQKNRCIKRDSRNVKYIDCRDPYLITKEGPKCTEYILVYFKNINCKCTEFRIIRSNCKCCRPVGICTTRKQCINKQWVFTEARELLMSSNIKLFNELRDSPMKTSCQRLTRKWTEEIPCEKPTYVKYCNVKTLRYQILKYYYLIENCQCVQKVSEKITKCRKCKDKSESRTPCGPSDKYGYGYLDVTTTSYQVNERNKCKKYVSHTRELCRCRKPRYISYCEKGHKVDKTITQRFGSLPRCKDEIAVKTTSIHCYNAGKPNPWILVKTEKCCQPGEYTIQTYERQVFNGGSCTCKKLTKKVRSDICCKPCKKVLRCVGEYNVEDTICEHSKNLKCIATTTSLRSKVECLRPVNVLTGRPVNCVHKYLLTYYANINCRCVKKTKTSELICCVRKIKKDRICENNRWKITRTTYRVVNERCKSYVRVDYEDLCTCHLNDETFEDTRIDKCTFWRSYFNQKIVNCQYVKNFLRKEKLNYMCCTPEWTVKTCRLNKIVVSTRHYFILCNFHCYPRTSREESGIDCSHMVLEERIPTGKCTVKDVYYRVVHKNCICTREVKRIENKETSCCNKMPYSTTHCNERNGVITTFSYTFLFKNYKCHKCEKRSSVKVHCNRKDCSVTVGPCIKDNNLVKMYCWRRVKCGCVKKLVHQGNQCCKPESFEWSKNGTCVEYPNGVEYPHHFFKKITYYVFRLNKSRIDSVCKPVAIRVIRKICYCGKPPNSTSFCRSDMNTRITTFKYTLNEALNSCVLTRQEKIVVLKGCTRTIRRVGIVGRSCDKSTGWGHIITEYIQAKHCKCVRTQKVKRCPCDCKVAFPTQVRSFCRNHATTVTETRTGICKRCRVQWCLKVAMIHHENCNRITIERGNCFPSTELYAISSRFDSKIQYKMENCKCVRREIGRTKKDCECRKTKRSEECLTSRIIVTTNLFPRVKGKCTKVSKSVTVVIPCPTKPTVTTSTCTNNKYYISTQRFYHEKCKCLSSTCKKQCDCTCPSEYEARACSGNYFINVRTTRWKKVDCRCQRYTTSESVQPICPKYDATPNVTFFNKGGDVYKKTTTKRLVKRRDACLCTIAKDVTIKIHKCYEFIEKRNKCKGNDELIIETWSRLPNEKTNKCEMVLVNRTSQRIKCWEKVVTYEFNLHSQRYKINTTTCVIKDCVIREIINITWDYCLPRETLVKRGLCTGALNCQRTNIVSRFKFRRGLKRGINPCVKVNKTKIVRCCCHPGKIVKRRYCQNNRSLLSTVIYQLVGELCPPRETIVDIPITCSKAIVVKKGPCEASGYKMVYKYRYVLRNCICVLEQYLKFRCRCKCSEDKVERCCNRAARVQSTTVTKYSVLRCGCVSKAVTTRRDIPCPAGNLHVSECLEVPGEDYSIETTTTTKYGVNEQCVCVSTVSVAKEICYCKRKEIVRRSCDKISNVITVRTSYIVLQNKACVRVVQVKRIPVFCGSGLWVLKGDSGCVPDCMYGKRLLTYVRQRVSDCQCKEDTKTEECHCMCNGPRRVSSCVANRIKHIDYSYKLVNCRCQRQERVSWEDVVCKQLPPIRRPCKVHSDGHRRKYTVFRKRVVVGCKCKTLSTTDWKMCRCRDPYNVTQCERNTNNLVNTRYWWVLRPKECILQSCARTIGVPCDPTPVCKVISRCMRRRGSGRRGHRGGLRRNRQLHECEFRRLNKCKCVVTKEKIIRPCICDIKTKIEIGPCNYGTCYRDISTTTCHLIVLRNNKTVRYLSKRVRKELCACCQKTRKSQVCRGNRLINITESYHFCERCKICERKYQEIDVTPNCCPARSKDVGKCPAEPFCNQLVTVTTRCLVQCKCQVKTRKYTRECRCCKKDYTTTECIGADRQLLTDHLFTLVRWKCREKVVPTTRIIRCPPTASRYLTPCRPSDTRVKQITSYRVHNCTCIKSAITLNETCRCRDPPHRERCNSEKGVYEITVVKKTYNEATHKCIRSEMTTTRPIPCDTKPKTHYGQCGVLFKCGSYRLSTTTYEMKCGCSCYPRSNRKYLLCDLPKPRQNSVCIKHRTSMTRVIYYEKVKSTNPCHDFECVMKEKFINPRPIRCRKATVTHGPCVNRVMIYTKTDFVIRDCVCTLRTRTYRVPCGCSLPNPEEISRSCINDERSIRVVRSWTLVCTTRGLIPDCKCGYIDQTIEDHIICARPSDIVDKCVGNKKKITIIRFRPKNCKCVERRRSFLGSCVECKSEMSFCKTIRAMGLCKRAIYREHLCQFTCKYCEECPARCEAKPAGLCECRKVAGVRVCSRKVAIVQNKIVNRKCVQKTSVHESLCSCASDYSRRDCEQLRKAGRCKEVKVQRKCQSTCSDSCQQCQGSIRQRTCVQDGKHKGTHEVVVVSFKRFCQSCLTKTTVTHQGLCLVCDKTVRKEVTDCVNGARFVVSHYVRKEKRRCVNMQSPVTYSCQECCETKVTRIGECSNGFRTVVTIFWAKVNNNCRKETVTNIYSCNSSCSGVSHLRSKCLNNKQIDVRVWKSGVDCSPHSVSEMASCLPFP